MMSLIFSAKNFHPHATHGGQCGHILHKWTQNEVPSMSTFAPSKRLLGEMEGIHQPY